jgi:hypothetical protein
MVEFQFYRPQANALEQLWSQYAQARGQQGGAFERGFTPGMMAGFEGIAKGLTGKAEIQARATEREEDRNFQRGLIAEKNAAEENQRKQLAADNVNQAIQVFSAAGENPHDAYMRGTYAKTPQQAAAVIATERATTEQNAKQAAAEAEAARVKTQTQRADAMATTLQANPYVDQLEVSRNLELVHSGDPDQRLKGMEGLYAVTQQGNQFSETVKDIEYFLGMPDAATSAAMGKPIIRPGQEDAFNEQRAVLIGAQAVLSNPKKWGAMPPAERQRIVSSARDALDKMVMMTAGNPRQDPKMRQKYMEAGYGPVMELGDQKATVVFHQGAVAGVTPQQRVAIERLVNEELSRDVLFRSLLRDQGYDNAQIQAALMSDNVDAMMASLGTQTPTGGDVRTLYSEAYARVTKSVLDRFEIKSIDFIPPEGYSVVQSMTPQQQGEVARTVQSFANDVRQKMGREATEREIADHLASKNILDLRFVASGDYGQAASQGKGIDATKLPGFPKYDTTRDRKAGAEKTSQLPPEYKTARDLEKERLATSPAPKELGDSAKKVLADAEQQVKEYQDLLGRKNLNDKQKKRIKELEAKMPSLFKAIKDPQAVVKERAQAQSGVAAGPELPRASIAPPGVNMKAGIRDPLAGMSEAERRTYLDNAFGIDRRKNQKYTLLDVATTAAPKPGQTLSAVDLLQRMAKGTPTGPTSGPSMIGPPAPAGAAAPAPTYNPLQLPGSNVIYAPAGRPPVINVPPGGFRIR